MTIQSHQATSPTRPSKFWFGSVAPARQTRGVFLLRVKLPDRPGSLGAVASAMGTVGADIFAVEIVERLDDSVVDDFMVELPDAHMPDSLVSACESLAGVNVLWLSRYPETWNLESDVEILSRMTEDPEHAAEILTEGAPIVFHCHWALLIEPATNRQLLGTSQAPDLTPEQVAALAPLDTVRAFTPPTEWLPRWGEVTLAMSPTGQGRVVILGRHGGPAWLDSELGRLRLLAAMGA